MVKGYFLFSVFLLAWCNWCIGQKVYSSTDPVYIENIDLADQQFKEGRLVEAIPHYEKALDVAGRSIRSTFR